MFRFARLLTVLAVAALGGCGGDSGKPQGTNSTEKPKGQVLTIEEFYADTGREERELRLVGQLKSWQRAPDTAGSYQINIAGDKVKTCSIYVTKPDDAEAPQVGKWIIVSVRGNNQPVSRTNGQFTKGSLHPGSYDTQEQALKAVGR